MKKLIIMLILLTIPITCYANDRMVYVGTQNNVIYLVDVDTYQTFDDGHMILGIIANDNNTGITGSFIYNVNRNDRTYIGVSSTLYINGKMTEVPVDGTVYTMQDNCLMDKAIELIFKNN